MYSDDNEELAWWVTTGPGGCLSGGETKFPEGSKVVLEWFGSANPNLMLHGLGAPVGTAAFTTAGVTEGGIRGHASSPDAITVSAVSIDTVASSTLYAQWIAQATLNFDLRGGSWLDRPDEITENPATEIFSVISDAGENYLLPAQPPVREGADFVEWNTAADASGDKFLADSNYPMPDAGDPADLLYAIWSTDSSERSSQNIPNVVDAPTDGLVLTLSFDLQGGSGGPDDAEEAQNDAGTATFTLPATEPTRENFTFSSWSTEPDPDAEGAPTYSPGDEITIEQNTILYAVWTPNQVIISYDLRGETFLVRWSRTHLRMPPKTLDRL